MFIPVSGAVAALFYLGVVIAVYQLEDCLATIVLDIFGICFYSALIVLGDRATEKKSGRRMLVGASIAAFIAVNVGSTIVCDRQSRSTVCTVSLIGILPSVVNLGVVLWRSQSRDRTILGE